MKKYRVNVNGTDYEITLEEVTGAEAGVDRRGHAAVRAGLDQLFGKPQVAVLVAQGHVGPLDGHHTLGVKRLAQGKLDLHGVGRALAQVAVQHGLLFIVQDHVVSSLLNCIHMSELRA